MYEYTPRPFIEEHADDFSLRPNHEVTIIGWDDTIPKERFTVRFKVKKGKKVKTVTYTPPGDGAWIIRNSWGRDKHNEGDFYISYYDAYVSMDADRT